MMGLGIRGQRSIQKGEKQKLEKEDELEMRGILVDCSPEARNGGYPRIKRFTCEAAGQYAGVQSPALNCDWTRASA